MARRKALGQGLDRQADGDSRREDPLQQSPHVPRRERVLSVAVPRRGHPDRGRRRRVGDGDVRSRQGQEHRVPRRDPVPALPRSAVQRFHRVSGLRGERGRIQGHGHGALWQAEVRGRRAKARPPPRRRGVRPRHGIFLVPPFARHGLQRQVRAPLWPAPRSREPLLHRNVRLSLVLRRQARELRRPLPTEPALRRYRREHSGGHRGDAARDGARRLRQNGAAPAVYGRRGGAQQRRERADPARDAVRGALRAARGRADMKDIANTKTKFREPYRPFAPSVLVERAHEFYDLKDAERHYPARFMLLVVDVDDAKREVVPAPTHVDGTARLQTVFRDTNPRYHRLIETFGKATGVPVLLNTSFNLKGEPIVNTPAEAFSTFTRSGMDMRSEEHTSELQSLAYLVCRLLLEKKKDFDQRQPVSLYMSATFA